MILLYRIFDAEGSLLYVGQTKDLKKRMRKHRQRWWAGQIDSVDTESFVSRAVAIDAERRAIRDEKPLYNSDLVGGHERCTGNTSRCKCWDCKRHRSKKMSEYRKSKLGQEPPSHGTTYGYVTFGCRCAPCSEAKNASDRRRYRRQRDGVTA